MMQKYTPIDYRTMLWKNGQGSTTELLIEPTDAGLDDFDWRISCANIQADGDFSCFRGVDRSLLVMSGTGVGLNFNQQVTLALTPESAALTFVGEDEVQAALLDGSITDFNVMTRRSRWSHVLEKQTFNRSLSMQVQSDVLLIYHAAGGAVQCTVNGAVLGLSEQGLLRIDLNRVGGQGVEPHHIELKPIHETTLYMVHLNQRI